MTPSLVAACLWILAANLAAMLPRRLGQQVALGLMVATGVPLLGWVTYQNGPWIGLAALAIGAATLRWPALLLLRRDRRAPPLPPAEPAE